MMAARELGDEELAAAASSARSTSARRSPSPHGARRYANASALANLYANLGRFGRHSGLRDLVAFGAPDAWRQGPVLAEAAYPDVLVAKAVTDGAALDLVLRPGAGPCGRSLLVERLVPGREYAVTGAATPTLTASDDGTAVVEVDLGVAGCASPARSVLGSERLDRPDPEHLDLELVDHELLDLTVAERQPSDRDRTDGDRTDRQALRSQRHRWRWRRTPTRPSRGCP